MIQIKQNYKILIPDTSSLAKKADYNFKITEIEGKIPDVSNLATKTALLQLKIKYLMLVVLSIIQIMIQKLLKLKRNLLIMIMINILLLQSLLI